MIEFIDLKTQQARIKDQIDAAIQRVLAHGQYILGPEVAELEEKLAAYTGARHCIETVNVIRSATPTRGEHGETHPYVRQLA